MQGRTILNFSLNDFLDKPLTRISDFASRSCSTCEYFNNCTLAKELISLTSLKPTQFVFECWHKTFDRKAQTNLINMVDELEL